MATDPFTAKDPFTQWLQQRLTLHGFRCVPDGFLGAGTIAKLRRFQTAKGLRPTGTANTATVAELRRDPDGRDAGPVGHDVAPPWLAEMRRRMGLHERFDNAELREWLASDGRTLGDPAKLPWCGDAVQTALALTLPEEPQLANPYLARNWLAFGKATAPRLGAVLIFGRGKDSMSGHVGFYTGEDADHFQVLGGNQANRISLAAIAKDRLLGARWPITCDFHTEAVASALAAAVSTDEA